MEVLVGKRQAAALIAGVSDLEQRVLRHLVLEIDAVVFGIPAGVIPQDGRDALSKTGCGTLRVTDRGNEAVGERIAEGVAGMNAVTGSRTLPWSVGRESDGILIAQCGNEVDSEAAAKYQLAGDLVGHADARTEVMPVGIPHAAVAIADKLNRAFEGHAGHGNRSRR